MVCREKSLSLAATASWTIHCLEHVVPGHHPCRAGDMRQCVSYPALLYRLPIPSNPALRSDVRNRRFCCDSSQRRFLEHCIRCYAHKGLLPSKLGVFVSDQSVVPSILLNVCHFPRRRTSGGPFAMCQGSFATSSIPIVLIFGAIPSSSAVTPTSLLISHEQSHWGTRFTTFSLINSLPFTELDHTNSPELKTKWERMNKKQRNEILQRQAQFKQRPIVKLAVLPYEPPVNQEQERVEPAAQKVWVHASFVCL